MTVSVASTTILSACGGSDSPASNNSASGAPASGSMSFAQGVASGDPQPDSVVLWTRVTGGDGINPVNVGLQVSTTADFTSLVLNTTVAASPDWDYTLRHQVTGLSANTTYFYRFSAGGVTSMAGRTWTLPAAGQSLSQLKFAVISCQDWSVNHWAAFDAMQNEDINFIVHVGNYVYEQLGITLAVTPPHDPQHPAFTLPNGTALPDGSTYATTLADYRTLYMTYRSDPRLQKLHANWPMIAIWNDHEFSNDCWQDHETYTSAEAEQTARRRSANQAWFEFMPTNVSFTAANTSFQNIQIYRSFTFGNLATLVMTDERLYRAAHEVAEQVSGNPVGSRYFVPKATVAAAEQARLTASNNALTPVSMLGDTQRQWWQSQMSTATTTWKLWGNDVSLLRMQVDMFAALTDALTQTVVQTANGLAAFQTQFHNAIQADLTAAVAGNLVPAPFTNLNTFAAGLGFSQADIQATIAVLNALLPPYSVLTTMLMNADQWDGYNAERLSLMSFLTSNNINNVVALTGDLNGFAAGTVMNDFDAATPTPVMVDLVTAGISSTSLFTSYVAFVNNPANHMAWLGKTASPTGANSLDTILKANNSWLAYTDTNAQGYSVITLTPSELTCNFRKLAPVSPTGQVPTAATAVASTQVVTVPANSAAVTVVTA
ncbi:MAG TPA: alkaline phosphatase D family protein [Paraburkholderia sp.]|nr:alkaline phosphatase D family protein [Paraburkholderia sp.]